ncbi:MAG: rhomboid family intramembrane serine protease [Oscillochloris sp.]|nr:rhomboid family intramembrane serine protease [Oscillochloris sp.]
MFPVRDENPIRIVPVVNNSLIAANIGLFVLELIFGERFVYTLSFVPQELSDLLAGAGNYGVVLTLFSAMFLHASFGHIIGNLLFLWIFGDNIEERLGSTRYLIFYLLCGILASLVQWWIDPQSTIPNLGASGAISGVLGAYVLLFPTTAIRLFVWPFSIFIGTFALPAFLWIGVWFVMQLFSGIDQLGQMAQGGVAFWAHIGGFVAGVALLLVLRPQRRQQRWRY